MIYGEAKRKSMLRSILPSSRRKTARTAKAIVKRKERRYRSERLNFITNYDDALEFEDYDCPTEVARDIRDVVYTRRDYDKLNHFCVWAEKITDEIGDDPVERYAYMKRLVPDNLIGRHALSHVRNVEAFRIFEEHDYLYRPLFRSIEEQQAAEKAKRKTLAETLTEGLEEVITQARLGEFNRILKAHWRHGHDQSIRIQGRWNGPSVNVMRICTGCTTPRCLLGAHDIPAFIAWYLREKLPVIRWASADLPPAYEHHISMTVWGSDHRAALNHTLTQMDLNSNGSLS